MQLLVTPDWLAARLNESGIVIVDATLPPVGVTPVVDTRARYVSAHIPGAVFFDIEELSDHATTLPHMLPSAEDFARSMSALGVGDDRTIVVYEQAPVFSAPRAWWMLRIFGVKDVRLLDGGLPAWIAAGLPVASGSVERPPASFRACFDENAVKSYAQVEELIAAHGQILDARSAARFAGTAPEPRASISSGHMPGATSVPFTELAESGRFKSGEQLRTLFAGRGVNIEQPITTTCGSGITAAVVALALEIAGANDVSLYDGSWAEYAQHPGSAIEKDS
jgi:thiosulfate/3-mercaptopyruvate sulfurtransferase